MIYIYGLFALILTLNTGARTDDRVYDGQTWLCAGQSNMEYTYARAVQSGYRPPVDLAARLKAVDLSFSKMTINPVPDPQPPLSGQKIVWTQARIETIGQTSAVCLLSALEYAEKTGRAVRYVVSAVGGTHIEAWMPKEAVEQAIQVNPEWRQFFADPYGVIDAWDAEVRSRLAAVDPISAQIGEETVHLPPIEDWPVIPVPGRWEDTEIGDVDGVVWLSRVFHLDRIDPDAVYTLSLGHIDDMDWTYVNTCAVGTSYVWSSWRRYRVPASCLTEGENQLLIRVIDQKGSGGLKSQPQDIFLEQGNDEHVSLAGAWSYRLGDMPELPAPPPGDVSRTPTQLYNGMIAPLAELEFDAVIWYQGESNRYAHDHEEYAEYLKKLILAWRKLFEAADLPFVIVQLPEFDASKDGHGHAFGEIRLGQFAASREVENVYLVSGLGEGQANDIHPWDKSGIAGRIVFALRAKQSVLSGWNAQRIIDGAGQSAVHISAGCQPSLMPAPGGKDDSVPAFEICSVSGACQPAPVRLVPGGLDLDNPVPGQESLVAYGRADLPDQLLLCDGAVAPAFMVPIREN